MCVCVCAHSVEAEDLLQSLVELVQTVLQKEGNRKWVNISCRKTTLTNCSVVALAYRNDSVNRLVRGELS